MRYDNRNFILTPPLQLMNPLLYQSMTVDECQLQSERVDIWQFPLHGLPAQAKYLLNKEETQRAERFYFSRHQRRFTTARAVMRVILGRYLNEEPASLVFSYNSHGKPSLSQSGIQFNISHSKDLALLAVGQTHPVGVDLEFFSSRPFEGIAKELFSEQELQALISLPASIKPLGFFHIWSQKEAFIKACGMGLAYPTKQFSVPVLPPTNIEVLDSMHNKTWRMASFMPTICCNAALCHDPIVQSIRRIQLVNLEQLF